MSNIAAIIVIYKDKKNELEKLKKSLIENDIEERDIYFSDNTFDNIGYSGGINRILKKIRKKYNYFFIVNPDVVVYKNCLSHSIRLLKTNNSIGIVGTKMLDEKGKIWGIGGKLDKKRYSGGLIDYQKDNKKYIKLMINVDFVSGTAMLIRKEVIEKIGLFTEDYFIYYEDVDYSVRAKKSGYLLVSALSATVKHYASTTMGKNSPAQQYYMARNHMLFVERFGPLSVKLYELLRLPKTLYEARNKKYELLGIRDFFLRRFGRRNYWSD